MTIKTEPGITVEAAFEHLALRIASLAAIYKRYKEMGYVGEEPTPTYWTSLSITMYVTGLVTTRQIAASGGRLEEGNRFFKFRVSDFTSDEAGEPTEPNLGDVVIWDGSDWKLDLGGAGTSDVLWKRDPTDKLLTVFARRIS